ncbi:hypothetical protein JNUCC64_27325 [Streptomyces sp. JNUCC 64]
MTNHPDAHGASGVQGPPGAPHGHDTSGAPGGSDADAAPATSRPRRVLRAVAIGSCLPYLALKATWLAGVHVGFPEGSPFLDHPARLVVLNLVTLLMDACVVVLALLLTRPWGRRVPGWLLLVPMWVAAGLLTPIVTVYPLQSLVGLLGGGDAAGLADGGASGGAPPLAEWVFALVYGGFILQAIALGGLFVGYARDRWGALWRGRTGGPPPTPGIRRTAVAAAVAAVTPTALHLLWAGGGDFGLGARSAAERGADRIVMDAVMSLFPVAAATGAGLLAFRAAARTGWAPLALTWLGSGAAACWGGWLTLAALAPMDPADRVGGPVFLAYGGQVVTGVLAAAVLARVLGRRATARRGLVPNGVVPNGVVPDRAVPGRARGGAG